MVARLTTEEKTKTKYRKTFSLHKVTTEIPLLNVYTKIYHYSEVEGDLKFAEKVSVDQVNLHFTCSCTLFFFHSSSQPRPS